VRKVQRMSGLVSHRRAGEKIGKKEGQYGKYLPKNSLKKKGIGKSKNLSLDGYYPGKISKPSP
jgi:hypothetical protein